MIESRFKRTQRDIPIVMNQEKMSDSLHNWMNSISFDAPEEMTLNPQALKLLKMRFETENPKVPISRTIMGSPLDYCDHIKESIRKKDLIS